ncbi:MAG: universal stress protein [Chloroflexi bacterium]|nr:universal stress protein [Chloroflexota bacterium]
MPHRVMVPLDGTASAETALSFLEDWPDRSELDVLLVAVWQATEQVLGGDHVQRTAAHRVVSCVSHHLHSYVSCIEERLRSRGIRTRSLLLPGHPSHHLMEVARQEAVDIILAGPRGLAAMQCHQQPRPLWCDGPCPIPA